MRPGYWGSLTATTLKGSDEQSSRKAPGSLADPGVCFGGRQPARPKPMSDKVKQKFDPRSPVQHDRGAALYFIVAIIAAIAIWTIQQRAIEDSSPGATSRPTRGDLRAVFSADDYLADPHRNGEQGN